MRLVSLFLIVVPMLAYTSLLDTYKITAPKFFEIKIDRDDPAKTFEDFNKFVKPQQSSHSGTDDTNYTPEILTAFEEFKRKFHRNYKDKEENQLRLKYFAKTWYRVQEANETGDGLAHFEINKFADEIPSEHKRRFIQGTDATPYNQAIVSNSLRH